MAASAIAMTDGGIETALIFQEGIALRDFAAFPLLYDADGRAALARYFDAFLSVADAHALPFVVATPTWRASPDWGARLGFSAAQLARANTDAVAFVRSIVADRPDVVVEGILGPRGDGYVVSDRMTPEEASAYHETQIAALGGAGVDRIAALTLSYADEAIGVVRAATSAGLGVVPSFTVETDGRLPDGTGVGEAIARVDAATDAAAEFFMINCAHPTHVARGIRDGDDTSRIGGLRVNASRLSHAELDSSEELDEGDPRELGVDNASLRELFPNIRVLGGCCGTDARHVDQIIRAW